MFSIKTKQVAGVTFIVGLAVILLSAWYISSLATVWLGETRKRAELLANAITHRAFDAVQASSDPIAGLQSDAGMRSILEASVGFSENVLYAEITDPQGVIIVHNDPGSVGKTSPPADDLQLLIGASPTEQARAIYTPQGRSFELRQPLLLAGREFGTVRIGVSTIFLKDELINQMQTPLATAAIAIVLASLVAMVLAQITLHPIHVIKSGLARLGRGELDVNVDLPPDAEMADLEDSFKAVSERLAEQRATIESVVENLEDAVALFGPTGLLLFANPAMRAVVGDIDAPIDQILPPDHPYRIAVTSALEKRTSLEPETVDVPGIGERLLLVHPVADPGGEAMGVMIVARNVAYLSHVESTLSYSRKLAALGRLSAGIAHEVKNPLNATMIHLELLKMQLGDSPAALEHLSVIAAQVRRLDEVVQGFLKFTRPEDLQLQPARVASLIEELMPIISAEASKSNVDVQVDLPADLPPVNGDPVMLRQAFLNLALNACQAMPHGGRLRIAGAPAPRSCVELLFEDTGVGISPEQLERIFDLYYTTKEHGSGIGLSLVYRTVQLHDGDIEVQSMPGRGTTFRLVLPAVPDEAGASGREPVAVGSNTLGLRDLRTRPAETVETVEPRG